VIVEFRAAQSAQMPDLSTGKFLKDAQRMGMPHRTLANKDRWLQLALRLPSLQCSAAARAVFHLPVRPHGNTHHVRRRKRPL